MVPFIIRPCMKQTKMLIGGQMGKGLTLKYLLCRTGPSAQPCTQQSSAVLCRADQAFSAEGYTPTEGHFKQWMSCNFIP